MLAMLFYLNDVIYAIACQKIREVIPLLPLKAIPHAPDFLGGVLNYRGEIVPVIDLGTLIHQNSCQKRLSTRIILVDYQYSETCRRTMGLIAEQVTDTIRLSDKQLNQPSVHLKNAPYLGAVIREEGRMIQYIAPDYLPDCIGILLPSDTKDTGCSRHL